MALVQVQKKVQGSPDNSTHSITFDSSPTEGNLLVVFIGGDITAPDPPAGYTQAVTRVSFVSGSAYYKIAGSSESSTISFDTDNKNVGMIAYEYSGLTDTPLDKTGGQAPTGSGTSVDSGSTGTTSQDNELIIACVVMRTDEVPSQTVTAWSNSFIAGDEISQGGTVGVLVSTAMREVSAIGDYSTTGTVTSGGLGFDVGIILSLRIADDIPPVSQTATLAWITA